MTNTRKKLTRPFLFLFEKLGGGLLVALGFVITLATVFAFQTLSTSPSTAGFQSGDTPLLSDGNAGNGTFDQSTDSLEAIRDAVDASGSDATAANQTTALSRVGENTDVASMSDSLFAGQEAINNAITASGGSPYIDWSQCEYKPIELTTSGGTVSCSAGYQLVTWSATCSGAPYANMGICGAYPTGINSIGYRGDGYNSNYNYISGGIKCCKYIVP